MHLSCCEIHFKTCQKCQYVASNPISNCVRMVRSCENSCYVTLFLIYAIWISRLVQCIVAYDQKLRKARHSLERLSRAKKLKIIGILFISHLLKLQISRCSKNIIHFYFFVDHYQIHTLFKY